MRSICNRLCCHFAVVTLANLVATLLQAEVRLPAVFSDHMVIQANTPVPIWGWANTNEKVTVEFAGQRIQTTANDEGKWRLELAPLRTDDTHRMVIRGQNEVVIKDVLVGEVWLASGQSNMAMTVQRARDFEAERTAAKYPQIRMFTVMSGPATKPQDDCRGRWVVCEPDSVGTFSATAYFFARRVHETLGVPVGVINSSVGGTAIESWTSMDAQKGVAELAPIFDPWDSLAESWDPGVAKKKYEQGLSNYEKKLAASKQAKTKAPRRPAPPTPPREDRNHPANLFNGKIAPLVPFAIRGAIWYQGEHNTNPKVAQLYGKQLEVLIGDWRSRWGQGDFPFAWVQLPNFNAPQRDWPIVREQMLKTLQVPHTGMAITIDIGDPNDIHPTNKQEVGSRLATWALVEVYRSPKLSGAAMGPVPQVHRFEGNRAEVEFRNADRGLKVLSNAGDSDGKMALKGFQLAGADHIFHPAEAKIDGANRVVVTSQKVTKPVAIRYAWASNPTCNLGNSAGLPASPFRTDDWAEPAGNSARATGN